MAGNMARLLLVVFAVQLTLIMMGIAAVPGSALWSFAQNPMDWGLTSFVGFLGDLTLLLSAGAVIVGTFFVRSDILIFAGWAGMLLSFGAGLGQLFNTISAASNPTVAMIFVSPLAILYVATAMFFGIIPIIIVKMIINIFT